MRTRTSWLIPLLAASLVICGCGAGNPGLPGGDSTLSGGASVTIHWPQPVRLIPLASQSVRVGISKVGVVVASQTVDRPDTGYPSVVRVDNLPVGNLLAVLAAYPEKGGGGTALAYAATPLTVQNGQYSELAVEMASSIARVEVVPAGASLFVGESVTLAAAATSAAGEVILTAPSKLSWSSSSAAVALQPQPDGRVRVTGVAAGSAQVTVTEAESGKSATATAAVKPAPISVGPIAFASNRDGNWEIYAMAADGTGQTRLTNDPMADETPAWSPDGLQIAFVSGRDSQDHLRRIYVMDADGAGPARVTPHGLWPLITIADYTPAWSPDGTRLAFVGELYDSHDGWEVFTTRADGTDLVQLTHRDGLNRDPAWSPDGRQVVFSLYDAGGNATLCSAAADGTGVTVRLTASGSGTNLCPAWSPDGSKIALSSNRDGNDEVYVMNADGSSQVRLTNNGVADQHPTWSPDGSRIAFSSNRDGNDEIYVMNADGTGQTRLTNNTWADRDPDWSGGVRHGRGTPGDQGLPLACPP